MMSVTPLLSQQTAVGPFGEYPRRSKISRTYATSHAHMEAAMISASVEDRATHFSLRDAYNTGTPAKKQPILP